MITKIIGEQPFQVLTNNFSISPSETGYQLQISADGVNYTTLFSVGANTTRLVTGVAANSYYRLLGNEGEVQVNWMKSCNTGGGGGDMSNYYTKSETDAEIARIQDELEEELETVSRVSSAAINELQQSDISFGEAIDGIDADLEHLSEAERVASAAINALQQEVINLGNDIPDVSNFVTSGEVQTQIDDAIDAIDLSAYYTSAQTETAITSKGYITSADTTNFASKTELLEKEEVISTALNELHNEIPDVSGYATAADLATVSGTVSALTAELSEAERVTSTAVNDIRNDITTLSGATANMVSSTSIRNIVAISQSDYDALTTKDNNTLYYII